MKTFIYLVTIALLLFSCNRVKQTTKETINKTGEIAGKGASEFFSGVKEGVDKTFQCELKISDKLSAKGITAGKFSINNSENSQNNMLAVYLIFEKDFKQNIRVTVIDKNGKEYGRTTLDVEGKKGDANYFDFIFDKRTDIESKSTFSFE